MSAHFSASFRNSCLIAPRHPKTKLPTTLVERNSLDFNDHVASLPDKNIDEKSSKTHRNYNKIKSERVIQTYEACRSVTFQHVKEKRNRLFTTASVKNKSGENFLLFDSQNSETLKDLINDDDQFLQHLQSLKAENKKTLKTLERLYNQSYVKVGNSSNRLKDEYDFQSRRGNNSTLNDCTVGYNINENSSVSSEDELDEQLKVKVPESHVNILPDEEKSFRGRSSCYDVIANMWENFSVDEYVPYTRPKRKEKNWSPSITIPEPFQMTIREEAKAKKKSKRIEKIEEEILQKKLSEEEEMKKRVVPTPLPPTTFLPLYQEINEHQKERRCYIQDLSKEILKSTEKPFSFIKREEAKKDIKRSQSLNNLYKKQNQNKVDKQFKANPFPDGLFDLTLADRLAEQEEYRKIKIKLRAEEMLASSSLPLNMKTRGDMRFYPERAKTKRVKKELQKRKQKSFQPHIHHDIPNFEVLQNKFKAELEERKTVNTPTICDPFNLHTAKVPTRRSKFRASMSSEQGPERSGSGNRSRKPNRSQNLTREFDCFYLRSGRSPSATRKNESPAIRISLTETARLRQERIRQSLEKTHRQSLRQSIEEKKRKKKESGLRKKVAKKALAQDPGRNRGKEMEAKLKSFKEADNDRRKEYEEYLKEIHSKLDERPLLFERESQTNAKLRAQRRYEEILQQAGVEGDILQSVLNADSSVDVLANSFDQNESDDGSYVADSYNHITSDVQSDGESVEADKGDKYEDESNTADSNDGHIINDDNKNEDYDDSDRVAVSDILPDNSDDGSYTYENK